MLIRTDDRPVSFTMEAGSPSQRIEPITLDEAKTHLRVTHTNDDTFISALIAAARAVFEEQTGRQCIDAVWEYALDWAPYQRFIELPKPPMGPTVTVVYDDANGDQQTFDADSYVVFPSYVVSAGSPADDPVIDPYCPCGRIELATGAAWPTMRTMARSLRIRRTCGYGATSADVPELVKATIKLILTQLYVHRGDEATDMPVGIDMLLRAFKWSALPIQSPTRLYP